MTSLDHAPTTKAKEPSADVPGAENHISAENISQGINELPRGLSESYALSLPAALMAMLTLVMTLVRAYGRAFRVPPEQRSYESLQGECEIMARLFSLMIALPPKYVTRRTIRFLLRLDDFAKRRFKYLQTVMAAHNARMDKIYKAYLAWRISVIHARAFMAGLCVSTGSAASLDAHAKHPAALIPP